MDSTVTSAAPKRFCGECHTTETSQWMDGLAGKESLCNVCWLEYHKSKITGEEVEPMKKRQKVFDDTVEIRQHFMALIQVVEEKKRDKQEMDMAANVLLSLAESVPPLSSSSSSSSSSSA